MCNNYLEIIKTIYDEYFTIEGEWKKKNVTAQEVYDYLTSEEPYEQGNSYFGGDSDYRSLNDKVKDILEKDVNWCTQEYYHIKISNDLPENGFLIARVVANIDKQETAIDLARDLYKYWLEKSYPQITDTIYRCKILLGCDKKILVGCDKKNKPVKMDKIVIYNSIPRTCVREGKSIPSILAEQMGYISSRCSQNPSRHLPKFVCQLSSYPSVGFGQGIDYGREIMAFSEPRRDCIYQVINETGSGKISLEDFQNSVLRKFDACNISKNIPFINKCDKAYEKIWMDCSGASGERCFDCSGESEEGCFDCCGASGTCCLIS